MPNKVACRASLVHWASSPFALPFLAIAGVASSVSPWHANLAAASAPTTALQALAAAGGIVLVVALLLLWVVTPTTHRSKGKKRTVSGGELDELGTSLWAAGKTVAVVLLGMAIFFIATVPLLSPSAPSQSDTGPRSSPAVGARSLAWPTYPRRTRPASVSLGWLLLPIAVTFAILTPAAVVIR